MNLFSFLPHGRPPFLKSLSSKFIQLHNRPRVFSLCLLLPCLTQLHFWGLQNWLLSSVEDAEAGSIANTGAARTLVCVWPAENESIWACLSIVSSHAVFPLCTRASRLQIHLLRPRCVGGRGTGRGQKVSGFMQLSIIHRLLAMGESYGQCSFFWQFI